MISFISRFRVFLTALLIIVPIELFVHTKWEPLAKHDTNFFEFALLWKESPQKFVVYEKLKNARNTQSEFIFIGDSSGLFGVMPEVVEKSLEGQKVMNLCVAADIGFRGYQYMADYYLRTNRNAKYLALYISPHQMPLVYGSNNKLTKAVYKNYLGPHRLLDLPIFSVRLPLANLVYYGKFKDQLSCWHQQILPNYPTYSEWAEEFWKSKGWVPFSPVLEKTTEECNYRVREKEDHTFLPELEKIARFSRSRGLRLAVLINPVACEVITGCYSDFVQNQLDLFSWRNPDVYIPFDLTTTLPENVFGDQLHLSPAAAVKNSERVGRALNRWISDSLLPNYYRETFSDSDRRGNLDGTVKSYDEIGHLLEERNYQESKRHGISRTYYTGGALRSERTYRKGKLDGICRKFYETGELEQEDHFQKGVRVDLTKRYHPNRRLQQEINYRNGLRHGVVKTYGPEGELQKEEGFREDKLDGLATTYYPDGKKNVEANCRNGLLHGVSQWYYPSGKLKEVRYYRDGRYDGVAKGYYESGALYQEIGFRYNDPKYTAKTYYEDGKLASEDFYAYGKMVLRKTYDQAGKLTPVEK